MEWGAEYEEGSAGAHALPAEGASDRREQPLSSNKRSSQDGTRYCGQVRRDAQIFLYSDGLRLPRTVGNTLLRFRSGSDSTAEIVGTLLAVLMRPELT